MTTSVATSERSADASAVAIPILNESACAYPDSLPPVLVLRFDQLATDSGAAGLRIGSACTICAFRGEFATVAVICRCPIKRHSRRHRSEREFRHLPALIGCQSHRFTDKSCGSWD